MSPLTVMPVEDGVLIYAVPAGPRGSDHQLVAECLQFTQPRSTVILRVGAGAERVPRSDPEQMCQGGLPGGNANELLRPFQQRGADRTGLGLGLAFSRWGVEANQGRIYARDLPDRGCVFTVDLPRIPVAAVAIG